MRRNKNDFQLFFRVTNESADLHETIILQITHNKVAIINLSICFSPFQNIYALPLSGYVRLALHVVAYLHSCGKTYPQSHETAEKRPCKHRKPSIQDFVLDEN
ncbi:MAG TPA: hypothetical protein PLJ44_05000 [Victivallales bacterium]|nr:hypothetical protein [Victivallales bacterium]